MAMQRSLLSFAPGKELEKMIQQRAKQQGITVSEYIREAIILELFFSGDLEAMKFVVKRVGRRAKDLLLEKVSQADLERNREALID